MKKREREKFMAPLFLLTTPPEEELLKRWKKTVNR